MQSLIVDISLIIVITLGITLILKNITRVPRPQNALVTLRDYAFPSGHTSFSFAVAIFYTYFILHLNIELIEKIMLVAVIFAGVISIIYWRLQIKVHTPLQILVGAILGTLVSLVVVVL
ncbi:MAG: phosphatase PAP2 family protein [Candidatus Pacebacteria bacterium]|nr:phosphatase PAP2 family protein [Candidatus Paceibacterota bacterium]